jgi:serine palmitoyltransferase
LYKNYGHICPIDELVAIKRQYCYRLIVDESFSFGTLGTTGRGAIELYGKKITEDVEIVIISLENSLASIGGMCVGDMEVVDHQRLSGAGYCFSASAPPFVAVAAMESLAKLERCPELLLQLNENRRALYQGLRDIQLLEVTSDERSSIFFIRLAERSTLSEKEEKKILARIARRCLEEGVLVVSAAVGNDFLHRRPPPSLKMTITAAHTNGEIQKTLKILSKVAADVLF